MAKISIILYFYKFLLLVSILVNNTQEQYNEILLFESSYPNSLTLK